jgi:NAD-dependent dihydropyrimidine dehydrogenase PreA subunit
MKRKIIHIDEETCNGCGDCVLACSEGAIQIIDGKARLVKEQYCDGMGDCLGECPTGALTVEERDVPDFDMAATRAHVATTGGASAVRRFEAAAVRHGLAPAPKLDAAPHAHAHQGGGCPGSRMRVLEPGAPPVAVTPSAGALPTKVNPSDLAQWPVQIHLVSPGAPFFKGKELVVMNTCGGLVSADIHWRFLRGRSVVVGCPKLDDTSGYARKLAAILSDPTIPKVIVVRMEVPCCGGLTAIARDAVTMSGRTDLRLQETTLSLGGDVILERDVTPPAEPARSGTGG